MSNKIAILTGTDVVDNLRMLRVTFNEEEGNLDLTDEYRSMSSEHVEKMLKDIVENSAEVENLEEAEE